MKAFGANACKIDHFNKSWLFANGDYGEIHGKWISIVDDSYDVAANATHIAING